MGPEESSCCGVTVDTLVPVDGGEGTFLRIVHGIIRISLQSKIFRYNEIIDKNKRYMVQSMPQRPREQ